MTPSSLRLFCLPLISTWLLLTASAVYAEDSGRSVVQALQARYDDTRPDCADGGPAYKCSGVIIRAIRDPDDPKFWNPSPSNIDREGVSFSYIRADVGNERLAGDAGLIMRPLPGPSEQPLTVRCVFPLNAATDSRIKSCGSEEVPLPCHLSGVTDIPTWQAHFAEYTGTKACYFEPTAQWFQFSIEVRKHFPYPDHRKFWNEIVIAPWPQDIPGQLPIEALYYSGDALEKARQMQDSFIQATGKFVPVVRVALEHPGDVFFYAPREQSQRYLEGVK